MHVTLSAFAHNQVRRVCFIYQPTWVISLNDSFPHQLITVENSKKTLRSSDPAAQINLFYLSQICGLLRDTDFPVDFEQKCSVSLDGCLRACGDGHVFAPFIYVFCWFLSSSSGLIRWWRGVEMSCCDICELHNIWIICTHTHTHATKWLIIP